MTYTCLQTLYMHTRYAVYSVHILRGNEDITAVHTASTRALTAETLSH